MLDNGLSKGFPLFGIGYRLIQRTLGNTQGTIGVHAPAAVQALHGQAESLSFCAHQVLGGNTYIFKNYVRRNF